jgi:hypothetical protein
VQLCIQINVIGKDWIKYPKRSRGVFPCLDDCSSKQVTQVTLVLKHIAFVEVDAAPEAPN